MATLTTENIIPIIRQVIRQEVPPIVQAMIHKEVPPIVKDIIRQEIPPITRAITRSMIREEVPPILYTETKDTFDAIVEELNRQGTLLEDLDDRFKADSELLRKNFTVKDQVDNHEYRLTAVESTQQILKEAVTDHSRHLKAA